MATLKQVLKRTSLLTIVISLSFSLLAQPTKDKLEVQQTVINFFQALSERDSVKLKSFSATNLTLIEYGQIWTLDTLIRKAIKLTTEADFKRENSIEFISSSTDKNSAWATYHLHSQITRAGKQISVHWLESVILVREKKKWKLKVLHSTLIKRS